MSACIYCKGRGDVGPVHINRGDQPHEWRETMACHQCDGTGQWDEQRLTQWRIGQELRKQRIARDESLREAAKRIGISPGELSAIEHGRAAIRKPLP